MENPKEPIACSLNTVGQGRCACKNGNDDKSLKIRPVVKRGTLLLGLCAIACAAPFLVLSAGIVTQAVALYLGVGAQVAIIATVLAIIGYYIYRWMKRGG